jgi:CspA family cold shock protein
MYRDTWTVCKRCSKRFVFRVREQRSLANQGEPVQPPGLCPACRLTQPCAGTVTGRVKWYSPRRGYGFIEGADGREVFFHRDSVRWEGPGPMIEGQEVAYEVQPTPRGPKAIVVRHPGRAENI